LDRYGPLISNALSQLGELLWNHQAMIRPELDKLMRETHDLLALKGELLSVESLHKYDAIFRDRFGPEVLRGVNGEALLELVKGNGRDALVYWLEFKDDDEFPANFGSIAGGSALKYEVYRRRETGAWTTGHPHAQREITTAEAVAIATAHRDQLLAASELLERLEVDASDDAYGRLQAELARVAPDVQSTSWGHKYLSLIHNTKLDDFHVEQYQRFHLIKTLQLPPAAEGRYGNAGRFVSLAKHFAWPLNHLTSVLNRRNGSPHRYWRIGTRSGSTQESFWDMMRTASVVAIGWDRVGDLSGLMRAEGFKEKLKKLLDDEYPKDPRAVGRTAQQIAHFAQTIEPRDYVLASDGQTVLGVGRIAGDYEFHAGERFPHRRRVEWLSTETWQLPTTEGLRTTVHELRKYPENLVAIEERVLGAEPRVVASRPPREIAPPPDAHHSLTWTGGGTIGRVQDVLARKSQLILYGPPGTGKTHWAERAAHELAALWNFGRVVEELTEGERRRIISPDDESFVRVCSFHPGYGYEDFIEGYRPGVDAGAIRFTLQDGIFKTLCATARQHPDARYYLIIDEINRGDIPRIFGELLTLLEKPKRGTSLTLPLSGHSFSVPSNVFVIGTMNTADRSIALLDAALRRRFGFVELMPDSSVLGSTVVSGIPLGPWLDTLNQLIVAHVGRDGRNLQVGHSYFLDSGRPIQDLRHLGRILQEDVLPLIEEYCYDDWERLEHILKKGFVDRPAGRFRAEVFDSGRDEDLVRAILAIAPEVSASSIAVAAEGQSPSDGRGPDEPDEEDEDGREGVA
jgi:5-methylcytosine-specific restriction enzyme B